MCLCSNFCEIFVPSLIVCHPTFTSSLLLFPDTPCTWEEDTMAGPTWVSLVSTRYWTHMVGVGGGPAHAPIPPPPHWLVCHFNKPTHNTTGVFPPRTIPSGGSRAPASQGRYQHVALTPNLPRHFIHWLNDQPPPHIDSGGRRQIRQNPGLHPDISVGWGIAELTESDSGGSGFAAICGGGLFLPQEWGRYSPTIDEAANFRFSRAIFSIFFPSLCRSIHLD